MNKKGGMMNKYYKVLDKNNCAKDGGSFDYTEYINSGKEVPRIEDISLCNKGYHLTQYWNFCVIAEDNLIYEVEAIDVLKNDEVGVEEKIVCKSFKFIKQYKPIYDNNLNTGYYNTGYYNTGNRNTGYYNTGNCNTGICNTGYCNTGICNTGYRNTGDYNTGNHNTGNYNTGYYNTGYRNTGDYNTGNCNTGICNTGYRNTGICNTGYYNTGNLNTGSFNTKKPKYTQLFNKNILFSEYKKIEFPKYFYFELKEDYKKSWIESFNNASKEEVEDTIKLPNFSYKIFEEITGISKKMIQERLK